MDDKKKGSRLPDDWKPTLEARAFARGLGFSEPEIDDHADRFRDYWIGVPGQKGVKLNWLATWRNYMRDQKDRRRHGNGPRRFEAAI